MTSERNAAADPFVTNLADTLNLDRDRAAVAVGAIEDALKRRIERASLSRGGLADVLRLLGSTSSETGSGDDALSVLTGGKHESRAIAQRAASSAGLDSQSVKQMLPAVADELMRTLRNGADEALAKRGFGVSSSAAASARGPLPLPGDNIPGVGRPAPRYDDIADDVRRGGTPAPGGGSLDELIRSIFGRLLGYQPKGIVGWIFRAVIARYAMRILQSILAGVLGGRRR